MEKIEKIKMEKIEKIKENAIVLQSYIKGYGKSVLVDATYNAMLDELDLEFLESIQIKISKNFKELDKNRRALWKMYYALKPNRLSDIELLIEIPKIIEEIQKEREKA